MRTFLILVLVAMVGACDPNDEVEGPDAGSEELCLPDDPVDVTIYVREWRGGGILTEGNAELYIWDSTLGRDSATETQPGLAIPGEKYTSYRTKFSFDAERAHHQYVVSTSSNCYTVAPGVHSFEVPCGQDSTTLYVDLVRFDLENEGCP